MRRSVFGAVAVPCLLLAATGCGDGAEPPSPARVAARTEREIVDRIERETGVPGTADCDRDFRVEEGATFTCVAGVDGQDVDYEAEVEEVEGGGRVDVDFDNVQAVLLVERVLDALVDNGLPETATGTVDCEGRPRVIVRAVGATFTCDGVLLAGGQGRGTVVFTVEDASGRVTFTTRRADGA